MDNITRLNIHKLVVIKLDAYIIAFNHVECLENSNDDFGNNQ